MSDSGMDILLGGAPGVKFPTIGTTIRGKVLSQKKQQSKNQKTGELKTWEDGNPIYEIVFTLATDARDPEVEDDDGTRRLFARGQMLKAIGQALRKAKWSSELTGGVLAVRYTADGDPPAKGFNPPKIYIAKFEPPEVADEFEDMAGTVEDVADIDEYDESPF